MDEVNKNMKSTEITKMANCYYKNGDILEAIQLYKQAAEADDAIAQYNLGFLLYKQAKDDTSYNEALNWFEKAAQAGVSNAQYMTAQMYKKGLGVTPDNKKAFDWYMQAANQDHEKAQKKCQLMAKRLAEEGNPSAQYYLGFMYDKGICGDTDKEKKAEEWYQKAAEQGFVKAYHKIGRIFEWKYKFSMLELEEETKEVQEEYKEKAIEWFTRAANTGDAEAQNILGTKYRDGILFDKDYLIAKDYFEKAANQGYCEAQENLGDLYLDGELQDEDYKQAFFWFAKAALEHNSASAQYNLGFMSENGLGVEPSYRDAKLWYEKSADNGNYDAYYRLGVFYFTGVLGKRDFKRALEAWEKASSLPFTSPYYEAKYCLSCMYLYGLGTDKDIDKSEKLWHECKVLLKQEDKDEIDELFTGVL